LRLAKIVESRNSSKWVLKEQNSTIARDGSSRLGRLEQNITKSTSKIENSLKKASETTKNQELSKLLLEASDSTKRAVKNY